MKKAFFVISLLLSLRTFSQSVAELIPPDIQWQRCYGGSGVDAMGFNGFNVTSDGGYIMCGLSFSSNGDVSVNRGLEDAWIVKTDAAGAIQWQRTYGGSSIDIGNSIVQTTDGGYIFAGETVSNDGDVSGNHGFRDLWVVKIDVAGNIQWQRCYGGSMNEQAFTILPTSDGGYIVSGDTYSSDGDVIGWHPSGLPLAPDGWILKLDANGNIQWQKCLGGSNVDSGSEILSTPDGGYLFNAVTSSIDGDVVGCVGFSTTRRWIVKMDNTGNIQWQRCLDIGFPHIKNAPGGGYIVVGSLYFPLVPGYHGGSDGYIVKLDASGVMLWQKVFGGTNDESFSAVDFTPDGGYVISGQAKSTDGDVCRNRGQEDVWVIKLDANRNIDWQKTYGGSGRDFAIEILPLTDGGFLVPGYTYSPDGDVVGNHGAVDMRVFKLAFPGTPVLPEITVTADKTTICPGQSVTFTAAIVDGGNDPFYQWQVNGINAGTDVNTFTSSTLNNGDVVRCLLTSNSACVTSNNATSNEITIVVDPGLKPTGFLPIDTAVCNFGNVELKVTGAYNNYLWNTGATTSTLIVTQPGKYWLDVITSTGCTGSDTVMVAAKECIRGVFIPTGFTPNNDGRNDLLKPIVVGNLLKYQFSIFNRWGQVVFQTSDHTKGWDGKFKGLVQDGNVFIWTCSYQVNGDSPRLERGTFVLIR